MKNILSKWHRLFPFIVAYAISLLSFNLWPHTISQEIWTNDPHLLSIQWNNLYGWNEIQKEKSFNQAFTLDFNGQRFYLAKDFGRFNKLREIKFESNIKNLRVLRRANNDTLELPLLHQQDSKEFHAKINQIYGPRNFQSWFCFFSGVLILTFLLNFFKNTCAEIFKVSQKNRTLLIALLLLGVLGQILFFYIFYPGFVNATNPAGIIYGFEEYWLMNPEYSTFLSMLWLCLIEVVPSFYFLLIFSGFSFLAFVIFLCQKMLAAGWQKKAVCVLYFLLLFSPVSLLYTQFLERSVWNAYIVCALYLCTFLIFYSPEKNSSRGLLLFHVFLSAAASMIRPDNIPSVLLLAGIVLLRIKSYFLRFVILSMAIAVPVMNSNIIENSFSAPSGWRSKYLVPSTIQTFSDIYNSAHSTPLDVQSLAIVHKVLKLESIQKRIPFEPIAALNEPVQADTETVNQYLSLYLHYSLSNAKIFLQSRAHIFLRLIKKAPDWFDCSGGELYQFALMNMGAYPMKASGEILQEGIRSMDTFLSITQKINLIPSFLILLFAISLWKVAPISALLCASFLSRLIIIFLLIPSPNFFYLFDLYLISIFIPFAIFFEHKNRKITRRRFETIV